MIVLIAGLLILVGICLTVFVIGHQYLGLALIFFGCLIYVYRWFHMAYQKHPKAVRYIRGILSVLLVIGTAYFMFLECLVFRDARTDTDQTADYIIVLGAGVNGKVPSLSLRNRLDATQAYLEAHPETIAILSGGQGPGEEITEAQCMYDWLIQRGISSERLIMEPNATSTAENLAFSKVIIESQKNDADVVVGVVSSEYHLHRAKLMAQQTGFNDPIGIAARTSYFTLLLNYSIREAFGLTHFYVFGY